MPCKSPSSLGLPRHQSCPGHPQCLKRLSLGRASFPPSLLRCLTREAGPRGHHFLSQTGIAGLGQVQGVRQGRTEQQCLTPYTGDTNSPAAPPSSCSSLRPQSVPDHCYSMDSSPAGTPSPQVGGSWFPQPPPGGFLPPKAEETQGDPRQPGEWSQYWDAHRYHCEPMESGHLQGKEKRHLVKSFKK